MYILFTVLPIVALVALFAFSMKQKSKGIPAKKVITSNLVAFALIVAALGAVTFTVSAANEAQPAEAAETSASQEAEAPAAQDNSKGLGLIAAAIVTGISGIGGGIAVAAGAPAAIAATTEDPKSFGKSLIFVALGESIALYGVVISILILNKV
ncbi:MAG: ATP synthase subunit C [Clostridia bacterium]|nr:ATP synthase subunit C [Clostridia bacterium]